MRRRRLTPALILLAGCTPDLSDLDERTKPNREEYCTHKAHVESADGYYDDAIYRRCMFGDVAKPDGGARD